MLPLTRRHYKKNLKNYYINQLTDATYEYASRRADEALKEDNWLDRKATWWEELRDGSEVFPSAELGFV